MVSPIAAFVSKKPKTEIQDAKIEEDAADPNAQAAGGNDDLVFTNVVKESLNSSW